MGGPDLVEAPRADQLEIAIGPDLCRLDLGLHVADHEMRCAQIGFQDVPDRIDAAALIIDFDRLELQPLGVGVDGIDNAAAPG